MSTLFALFFFSVFLLTFPFCNLPFSVFMCCFFFRLSSAWEQLATENNEGDEDKHRKCKSVCGFVARYNLYTIVSLQPDKFNLESVWISLSHSDGVFFLCTIFNLVAVAFEVNRLHRIAFFLLFVVRKCGPKCMSVLGEWERIVM